MTDPLWGFSFYLMQRRGLMFRQYVKSGIKCRFRTIKGKIIFKASQDLNPWKIRERLSHVIIGIFMILTQEQ